MILIPYLLILIAYLLGSISSAVIFCKLAGLADPREVGSHNAGATNVLRIGGKSAALGVLLFDILKGTLPVAIGVSFNLSPSALGFIALAVCLGHIFPIFFQFKGGKGVATALGAISALSFVVVGGAIGTWLLVFSSLATPR